ncbi:Protein of unknown function [Desulfomicrobium apsheronum]|uniref:DUF4197 domain-containing protein n=1 Tax=Desulfomicrobium apsheronum TaxID=52560 RepID=A0A1I3VGQ3_9BACT|nr:DUF4197 domain-containing protein [Desulfomicrobium apsheronum]SFJ93387.1 Protein of unknown function [Desulfomicrobium apsheronum]
MSIRVQLPNLKIVCALVTMLLLGSVSGWAQNSLLQQGLGLLSSGDGAKTGSLSQGEMGDGLKEALRVGTENVVAKLGQTDGFNTDEAIHIPLPGQLATVQKALKAAGYSSLVDDLELKLNRAAEQATPKAKALFVDAISAMTIEDAQKILSGPEDSATQYFRKSMGPNLSREMKPIVDTTLADAGAVQAYDNMMGQYKALPFMPDVKANLSDYVVEKGMDGIFHYVAKEEAAIRTNPAARTTDLLKKVFAQ